MDRTHMSALKKAAVVMLGIVVLSIAGISAFGMSAMATIAILVGALALMGSLMLYIVVRHDL